MNQFVLRQEKLQQVFLQLNYYDEISIFLYSTTKSDLSFYFNANICLVS